MQEQAFEFSRQLVRPLRFARVYNRGASSVRFDAVARILMAR